MEQFARSVGMSAQHTEPMLNIGEMSEILGFNVTEAFLAKLSFKPAAPDSIAKLYRESEFSDICMAISRHAYSLAARQSNSNWVSSFTDLDGDKKEWFVLRDDGNPVAKIYPPGSQKTAQLLAASNELLDALKDMLDVVSGKKQGELVAIVNAIGVVEKAELGAISDAFMKVASYASK